MTVEIKESSDPVSEQDIVEVERQLGFTLLTEYKDFLLAHNGGYPEPDAFPIHGNPSSDYGLLDQFLRIKAGDIYSLQDYFNNYWKRIPSGFLPIARDPGGNLICLSVSGENAGKVYFWDHEEEAEEGETPGYDNVYFVANSFNELLESLTVPD